MAASPSAVWPPPPPASPPPPARQRGWVAIAVVAGVVAASAAITAAIVVGPRLIRVDGSSMSPVLQDGDRAIFVRLRRPPPRGTIVAFRYPVNPTRSFALRIVGLPGERLSIADGVVSIDGRPLAEPYLVEANRSHENLAPRQLGPSDYFVMGDNRRNASDSREWGVVPRGHVWAEMHTILVPGPSRRR